MTVVQPSGLNNYVDMPDDVPMGDLIRELVAELRLPTVQSDGLAVAYKMHSKSLGREIDAAETLASASVPPDSVLYLFPFAGAGGDVAEFIVSSGSATAAAAVLIAYIRQRKADFKLKITRRDGTELEFDARRISDPKALTREIVEALNSIDSVDLDGSPEDPNMERRQPGPS